MSNNLTWKEALAAHILERRDVAGDFRKEVEEFFADKNVMIIGRETLAKALEPFTFFEELVQPVVQGYDWAHHSNLLELYKSELRKHPGLYKQYWKAGTLSILCRWTEHGFEVLASNNAVPAEIRLGHLDSLQRFQPDLYKHGMLSVGGLFSWHAGRNKPILASFIGRRPSCPDEP